LDDTRVSQLATDNAISASTTYTYLHEGIDLLADQAPSLRSALLAAKMAGYSYVSIDGTDRYWRTSLCRRWTSTSTGNGGRRCPPVTSGPNA
jgi:hypothetical protein